MSTPKPTYQIVYVVTHVSSREVQTLQVFAGKNDALELWTKLYETKKRNDEVRISAEEVLPATEKTAE